MPALPKEKLVVLTARLAFAVPEGASAGNLYDVANMMLIPEQRREHDAAKPYDLIDYTLDVPVRTSDTPVEGYDYDEGFTVTGLSLFYVVAQWNSQLHRYLVSAPSMAHAHSKVLLLLPSQYEIRASTLICATEAEVFTQLKLDGAD